MGPSFITNNYNCSLSILNVEKKRTRNDECLSQQEGRLKHYKVMTSIESTMPVTSASEIAYASLQYRSFESLNSVKEKIFKIKLLIQVFGKKSKVPLDVIAHIAHFVADPRYQTHCLKYSQAMSKSYSLIWHDLQEANELQDYMQNASELYPQGDFNYNEVCKERIKYIYSSLLEEINSFPQGDEMLKKTISNGIISAERLIILNQWVEDQNLYCFIGKCIPELLNLCKSASVEDKAAELRLKIKEDLTYNPDLSGLKDAKITRLPKEIGCFHNLHLQLLEGFGNRLMILPNSIGQLTNLNKLEFIDCGIKILPESIGQLTNLRSLSINCNKLKKLPQNFTQLINLRSILLEDNKLQELPEGIKHLINLRELDISYNKLQELPESIGQLINLRELDISYNKLQELPESIGQLINLQNLDISDNKLQELPESIGQLINLRELDISYNKLQELPESIGQLIKLQYLRISNNELQELPESFGQLIILQQLFLQINKIQKLPESFKNLVRLITFSIIDDHDQILSLFLQWHIQGKFLDQQVELALQAWSQHLRLFGSLNK